MSDAVPLAPSFAGEPRVPTHPRPDRPRHGAAPDPVEPPATSVTPAIRSAPVDAKLVGNDTDRNPWHERRWRRPMPLSALTPDPRRQQTGWRPTAAALR
jgi:hypothetical protein